MIYCSNVYSEQFDFRVKEIEILNNGNLFKGLKRGIIETDTGTIIEADKFTYDKILNILYANGEVKIQDTTNNYIIYSDEITYKKNEEIIFTNGNSKAFDNNKRSITANEFIYKKITNILNAKKNVDMKDEINDFYISSEKSPIIKMNKNYLQRKNNS